MTQTGAEVVDIPDPELIPPPHETDPSEFDPGADLPPGPPREPALGEDPAYDPGGLGRQPDVAEDDADHR